MPLDPEHRSRQPAHHFDPRLHITADRLRASGIAVPARIPGHAWISKQSVRARTVFVAGSMGRLEADFLEPFVAGDDADDTHSVAYADAARRAQGLVLVGPKGA